MTTTVLAPDDKGQIKCRECGKTFPPIERTRSGGGRSGWALLREHVKARHHPLNHALEKGLAAWWEDNARTIAEGSSATGTDTRSQGGQWH